MESVPASRRHPGSSSASTSSDLMATWTFCLFYSLCQLGMNPNPSTPVFLHCACAGGQASHQFLLLAIFSSLATLDPPYGPITAESRLTLIHSPPPPPLPLCRAAHRLPHPTPPHIPVPSGGTGLITPSSPRDVHRR
jgi:hypothetical protein